MTASKGASVGTLAGWAAAGLGAFALAFLAGWATAGTRSTAKLPTPIAVKPPPARAVRLEPAAPLPALRKRVRQRRPAAQPVARVRPVAPPPPPTPVRRRPSPPPPPIVIRGKG
jgi:hypothetical protein